MINKTSLTENSVSLSNTAIICLSPNQGGMEIDAVNTAKSLCKLTDVIVIAKHRSFIQQQFRAELEEINVPIETIKFYKNFSFSIIFTAKKLIKKHNIKNVIFFGASELKSLYFSFLGQDINLIIRHVTTKSTSKKDLLHRIIYSDVNYHVTISGHLEKNVKNIIPFGKNSRIKIIYPSINQPLTNIQKPKYENNHPISLLHVGRIIDGKGQLDAIKACEILYEMKRDFIFHIVGKMDPDYENEILSYLETVPYKDSIKIESFTSDIDQYYKESDIYIFPSKGEGFGLSFVEALSFGLICIAYKNTSFPEFKELGFEFLIAKNLDINSLKSSLKDSLHYIDNNKTPLSKNIQLSQELFSEKRLIQAYKEILVL